MVNDADEARASLALATGRSARATSSASNDALARASQEDHVAGRDDDDDGGDDDDVDDVRSRSGTRMMDSAGGRARASAE